VTGRRMSVGKRGTVTDYSGEAIFPGDLIAYATRAGNRVRMTDAIVLKVTAVQVRTEHGTTTLVPMLHVEPTGDESGFTRRKTLTTQWINAEHARLILPGAIRRD